VKGNRKELFKCSACGSVAKLDCNKRHWCNCNPSAPFAMHSVKAARVTDGIVVAYLAFIGARGGKAGTGKAKARSSEQARKAALAGVAKRRAKAQASAHNPSPPSAESRPG